MPLEEHVSLWGSEKPEKRVSLRGGREVSIFFPVTPPRSMCRSGGSGGKYLLPRHAAEKHVSLRGVGR